MSLVLRLAARNVFRQRARTAVALSAIAAGCAALIVNGGVVHNIFRELRDDAIYGRHGHLQVYRNGYSAGHLGDPGRYLIPAEESRRIVDLVARQRHVAAVTRVREFSGMIAHGDRHVAFLGFGVDPEQDAQFSRHVTLRRGAALSSGEPYGFLAGLGLAEKFGGEPGALVTLLAHTENGALNAVDARLRGVFEGGMKAHDDFALKLPLATAEALLLDDRTEQIVVLLDRTEDVPAVQRELEAQFAAAGLDLETRTWRDLAVFHNQTVSLFNRELDVIGLIVATMVVLGIANTVGMSIFERRVELATLRALGLGRVALARLLLLEAAITGLLGALLGLLLGAGLALTVSAVGIPFPSPPGSTRPFRGGVDLVPAVAWAAFALSFAATIAAAALPVWRAARRPIAPQLRDS